MRAITALFKAATKAENFVFGVAVEMNFPSGFSRMNTSPYVIAINGNNFAGTGQLGTVSSVSEESSLTAKGVTLTLSGIDPAMVNIALSENPQGRSCKMWVCLFDANHALIADPYPVGVWRMDTMDVTMDKTATISLKAESVLADWSRPRVRYYTDGDQQSRWQGDVFFDQLAPNLDKEILWGRS